MPKEYSVLLADDHAVLRSGLFLLLKNQDDFSVVGEASTGLAAVALVEEVKPDLVLLDLTMPGLGGLEAIPIILQKSPKTRILVLTMHNDPEYLKQAIKSGAKGYILKKAAHTELLSAMRSVMRGEIYLHSAMTKQLLEDLLPDSSLDEEKDSWKILSSREQQVLRLVALGHTSLEIAGQLNLSAKTIDTYRRRGLEKLNIETRAALVRYAIQHKLLD